MRAKPVNQKRSQDKRDRILNALDTLLARKPFVEISIAELAKGAEVSPATIYQRFSNVEALASVLLELYFLKVEEWAKRPRRPANSGDSTLFDLLMLVAGDAYDLVSQLGYIMRPAYLYSRQRPDLVGSEWSRLDQLAVAGFKSFLAERAADIKVVNIDEAAELLANFFNLMLLGPLLHKNDSNWKTLEDREKFTESLATMAYRYLVFQEHKK